MGNPQRVREDHEGKWEGSSETALIPFSPEAQPFQPFFRPFGFPWMRWQRNYDCGQRSCHSIGQWVWIKTEEVSSQWPGKHSGPFHQLGLSLPSSSFPAQQQLWEASLVHYQPCRQPYSSQWWVTPKATSALQLEEPSSGVDDPTSLGKREEWCVYEFWESLSSPHCGRQRA